MVSVAARHMGVSSGDRLRPFLGDVWGPQEITLVQDKLTLVQALPGFFTSVVQTPVTSVPRTSRLKGSLDKCGGRDCLLKGREEVVVWLRVMSAELIRGSFTFKILPDFSM